MHNAKVFHGGGHSPGFSSKGNIITPVVNDNEIHLLYNNADIAIASGEFIRPPDYNAWVEGNGAGYYSGNGGFEITDIYIQIHRYKTEDDLNDFSLRFEYYNPADGSKSSVFSPGDGVVFLDTFYRSIGNTASNYRYHLGAHFGGLTSVIPAGSSLFCYCCFNGFLSVDGLTCRLRCKQLPPV